MTKTAWIFGDSFQDRTFPKGQEKSWTDIVFSEKGYEVKNYARAGVSTEAITLMCVDCINEIKPDDYVLVCLSAGRRFMYIPGQGTINRNDNFTRYIDNDKKHLDIYSEWVSNNKDNNILKYSDRFHSSLSDKLKHSICNNYISLLLRNKGVSFNIIHGHFEPVDVKESHVKNLMPELTDRIFSEEVRSYYDMTDAIEFPSGYCLINDFFNVQIQYILDTHGADNIDFLEKLCKKLAFKSTKNIGRFSDTVQEYFIGPIELKFGKESCIFFDAWHLNPTGQEVYASYAKDYDWEI